MAIAREPVETPRPGSISEKKCSRRCCLTIRNIPAALYKSLGGFATNSVNILKLESYIPGGRKKQSEAQFFLTLEGHPRDRMVQLALEELGFFCKSVTVLGVYPADPAQHS